MSDLAAQLRYKHGNQFLAGKTLSRAVSIAQSIGVMAEQGKQFSISERIKDVFVGTIQVGEYILTGQIPAKDLVESVISVQPEGVAA